MKEEKPKVDGSANPKGPCFQKPASPQKPTFKAPTLGLKDKMFDFRKKVIPRNLLLNVRKYPIILP